MSKSIRGIWGIAILAAFCVLIVLVLCTGPPAQFEPVGQYIVGSMFQPMAITVSLASFPPQVLNTGPAALLPAIDAMPIYDRYMRAEIPVALPPARAVIDLRATAFLVMSSGASRASPARLRMNYRPTRVLQI